MSFHSIRNRIVIAVPQLSMFKLAIFVATLLTTILAQAQWKDPLESPSFATDKAHKSLLLDITRVGNRLVAVGAHGHVVYSDDSGQSWIQAKTPSSVTLTSVYFPKRKQWAGLLAMTV